MRDLRTADAFVDAESIAGRVRNGREAAKDFKLEFFHLAGDMPAQASSAKSARSSDDAVATALSNAPVAWVGEEGLRDKASP